MTGMFSGRVGIARKDEKRALYFNHTRSAVFVPVAIDNREDEDLEMFVEHAGKAGSTVWAHRKTLTIPSWEVGAGEVLMLRGSASLDKDIVATVSVSRA